MSGARPSPWYRSLRSPSLPKDSSTHAPGVSTSTAGKSEPHTPFDATPRWRPLNVKKTAPLAVHPQPTVSPTPNDGPQRLPPLGGRGKASWREPLPEW